MKKTVDENTIRNMVFESLKNVLSEASLWDYPIDDPDETDEEEYERTRYMDPDFDKAEKDNEIEYMWQAHGNQNIDKDQENGWASMAAQSDDPLERAYGQAVRSTSSETDANLFANPDFEDDTLNESHIRKIVAEAIMNMIGEDDDEEDTEIKDNDSDDSDTPIKTYYTVTTYYNGKKSTCMAFKKLKNAEKQIEIDIASEKDSMQAQFNRRGVTSKFEIIEPDYYDEEFDQAVRTPTGRLAKHGNTMNNGGFEVKYSNGCTITELMGEEEGNIEELEAADRFSDETIEQHKYYVGLGEPYKKLRDERKLYAMQHPEYEGY